MCSSPVCRICTFCSQSLAQPSPAGRRLAVIKPTPFALYMQSNLQLSLERDDAALNYVLIFLNIQLPQFSSAHIIDQSVNLQSALMHGVNDDRIGQKHLDAASHIEFDHLEPAVCLIQAVQEGEVVLAQGPQRHQPGVDEAELFVAQGRGDAAAGGMSADYDVFYLQVLNGVLYY